MKPYYEDHAVEIYHGDCRKILLRLGPVDHIITDPPYSEHVHASCMSAMSAHGGKIAKRTALGFAPLDDATRLDVANWCGGNVKRWMLFFSDVESSHLWKEDLECYCCEYVRTGAWIKVGGAPQFTGDRPAVGFEAIVICHRMGKKQWNGGGKQGIWSFPIVVSRGGPNEVRVHTAQKPLKLLNALITDFTDAGDVIIDPFMGSGTTLRAAKDLGRRAIGIDKDERSCEIAAKRMMQEVFDFGTKLTPRGGETVTHVAHNHEIAGSIPARASRIIRRLLSQVGLDRGRGLGC